MAFWVFVRREAYASARAGKADRERVLAVLMMAGLIAACTLSTLQYGWHRPGRADDLRLARVLFALVSLATGAIAAFCTILSLAPAIAGERDAKRLDALLTTRLSSTEIILGTLGAGLLHAGSVVAASAPLLVFLAVIAGIPPLLFLLTLAGIAATSLWAGAIAVWASSGAATRAQAIGSACSLALAWLAFPHAILTMCGILLPSSFAWVVHALYWLIESSPPGLAASLLSGVITSAGRLHDGLLRMIAVEVACTLVLVPWSIARLRPSARALHDAGARTARVRLLRLAPMRRPRRPCGDDPVLWNALEACRPLTNAARLKRDLARVVWLGMIAAAVAYFAIPAFGELAERGYGAAAEAFRMPRENVFARILLEQVIGSPIRGPAPGQARLEFNVALRIFSASCAVLLAISLCANAAEGMEQERLRGTWLLLLTTPLTAREILRAKMLAPLLRARWLLGVLIATWLVGALAGAVHPLGLLAEAITFAAVAWFAVTVGLGMPDEPLVKEGQSGQRRPVRPLRLLILVPGVLLAFVLLPLGPAALAWGALFSYEDVHALVHGGTFPQLARVASARTVAWVWLAGTAIFAFVGFCSTIANERQFDTRAGRPMRAGGKAVP